MSDAQWKDALWNLLEILPLRRITARIALSAGLIGLASQAAPDALGQPRVPISPMLSPEATVRKFKGKYVLKRAANSFFIHLAGHRSHSSHSSHRSHSSHSSHSSSSHYSGAHSSHFSSSPSPSPAPSAPATPKPTPPRSEPLKIAETPAPEPRPKPIPIMRDAFDTSERLADRWRIGVLATPAETFDSSITIEQNGGLLSITPVAQKPGARFSGYVSIPTFDLNTSNIVVELRRPAAGATTIFAAAIDSGNWRGFRIEGGQLSIESHTNGRMVSKKIAHSASQHRFLRMRMSAVAPVVVWETSANGTTWNPEYVETASISVTALRIALSAGSPKSTDAAVGPATFGSVTVERQP